MHPIWVPAAAVAKRGSGRPGTTAQRRCEGGVQHLEDLRRRHDIDQANSGLIRSWLKSQHWDGILLDSLDLLGPELLPALLKSPCIVQHHVGFVHAPFPPSAWQDSHRYRLVAASGRQIYSGAEPTSSASVIYPGVRSELFGVDRVGMPSPLAPDDRQRPLKVCFGLLMGSKGPHT